MFPSYKYIDSNPYPIPNHGDHMPHPCYLYQNREVVPPHMRADTSKPPSALGPWIYNSNISHPRLAECNSCCIHTYPPGYFSFRPPYPHSQLPPQSYYQIPYPYHDAYPYFVPPHYSVNQAQYDHDKAKNHCCGCLNNTCCSMDNSGLKIEEQKPEPEKDSAISNIIQLPNYSYPMVYVPPSYPKDRDVNINSESRPAPWNGGWVPVDINSLKDLMQAADEKKNLHADEKKNLLADEKKNQYPRPFIWMPGNIKPEDAVKDLEEISANPRAAEEVPKLKIIPIKFLENDSLVEKPSVAENEQKTLGIPAITEKENKAKTIPVKHIGESCEKILSLNDRHKEKDNEKKSNILEKPKDDDGVKKTSHNSQSAQAKLSKLPPICLRINPLTKQKTTNGKSRSPSPTGHNDKEKVDKDNAERKQSLKEIKEAIPKKEIQVVDVNEKPENLIEIKQKKTFEELIKVVTKSQAIKGNAEATGTKVVETLENKKVAKRNEDEEIKVKEVIEKIEERKVPEGKNIEEMKESKIISPVDAATIIQSAYKGYDVRRSRPLEKLKKISQIRKQVDDLGKQIQGLEASSNDQVKKHRMVMSENIMNLLLQLDTIQGLHQSVREARKLVARELICLQEKLDTLGRQVIADHKTTMVEESSDGASSLEQAVSGLSSSAQTEQGFVQKSLEPVHYKNMMGTIYAENREDNAEEERQAEIAIPETPFPATGIENGQKEAMENAEPSFFTSAVENVCLLNDEKVSASPEEHDEPEKSDFLKEELSFKLDESAIPSSLSVQALLEASSVSDSEFPILKPEEHPEEQDYGCQGNVEEQEQSGHRDDVTTDAELEKVLVTSVQNYLEEAATGTVEQPEHSFEVALVELPSEQLQPDFKKKVLIVQTEIDTHEMVFRVFPEVESSDPVERSFGAQDGQSKDMECPDGENVSLEIYRKGVVKDIAENLNVPAAIADIAMDKPVILQKMGDDSSVGAAQPGAETEASTELPTLNQANTNEHKAPHEESVDTVHADAAKAQEETMVRVDNDSLMILPAASTDKLDLSGSNQLEDFVHLKQITPVSATSLRKEEIKLVEENEKLREMLERLLEAGKAQLGVIYDLNSRVKDLERKLLRSEKKRVRVNGHKHARRTYSRYVAS